LDSGEGDLAPIPFEESKKKLDVKDDIYILDGAKRTNIRYVL